MSTWKSDPAVLSFHLQPSLHREKYTADDLIQLQIRGEFYQTDMETRRAHVG